MSDFCLVLAGSPSRSSCWIASCSHPTNCLGVALFAVADDVLFAHTLHGLPIYS